MKKITVQRGFPALKSAALKSAAALLAGGLLAACSADDGLGAAGTVDDGRLVLTGTINGASPVTTRSTSAEQTQFTDGTDVDLFVTSTDVPTLTYLATGGTMAYAQNQVLYLKSADVAGTRLFEWYADAARMSTNQLKAWWPGDNTASLDFKAYSPAGLVTNVTSTAQNIVVPADQGDAAVASLATPSGSLSSDILGATLTGQTRTGLALPMEFHHLMSKVTVTLEDESGGKLTPELETSTVTLGTTERPLQLSGTLNAAAQTVTATDVTTGVVTLKDASVSSLKNYCLLPPGQSLLDVQVTVTTTSGAVRTYTLKRDVELEAGCNYQVKLYVNDSSDLSATLSLSNWGDQGQEDAQTTVPLTIEALAAGVTVKYKDKAYRTSKASENDGAWSDWSLVSDISVTLPAVGDKIQFIGSKQVGAAQFTITGGNVKVYGNIMSLESGYASSKFSSAYATDKVITDANAYKALFKDCTNLVDASGLVLPATTLTEQCYLDMFNGCINLTVAPELPATTLAEQCYQGMFDGCSSLTVAPELPATTLTEQCYLDMFNGCTNLTVAPELPATTLVTNCYGYLFYGCSKLASVRINAASGQLTNANAEFMMSGAGSGIEEGTGKIYGYSSIITDLTNNCDLNQTAKWIYGGAY